VHDVAVVGLGAIGSAVARELAGRGLRVVGFDRHAPPHELGSSHGASRIIREAYFEDPVYVPMVQRAQVLWRALERECGRTLLRTTGGVMLGRADTALVRGALRSAELHGLPHTVLDASAVAARFPVLRPESDMLGVWEPNAGVLDPEACVLAQLERAVALGALLHTNTAVHGWEAGARDVTLATDVGRIAARTLVLAAGPWIADLLPGLPLPFAVERQVLHWFEPARDAAQFAPDRCPIHLWEFDGARFYYGFPDLGGGVKLAFHHGGEPMTAATARRTVDEADVAAIRAAVRRFTPAADGRLLKSTVCLYTNTPDEHFRIDRHPAHAHVVIASPCSGHGFKFAPVVGEIVADLVMERAPAFDLAPFRWR